MSGEQSVIEAFLGQLKLFHHLGPDPADPGIGQHHVDY